MHNPEFRDKFIGFADILGFKRMVEAAAAGTSMPLGELLECLKYLGGPADQEHFRKYGPTMCPETAYVQRDLDFQLSQVSDCVVVSSEVSPAGAINLINHCWGAVIKLLTKGIMCRGYITRGVIYHSEGQFIGPGFHEAYGKEAQVTAFKRIADERGTPFVEVDPVVGDYVREHGDRCVKEMFSRFVKEDGGITALFPFKRLGHSFIIGGDPLHRFDPEKERRANEKMRVGIETLKERVMALVDRSNPNAVTKAEHYIAALDAQLAVCTRTDEIIDALSAARRDQPT